MTAHLGHRLANFDRVARIYRWVEYLALGPLLERTREHFIASLGERRNVLVLGDGDGRFLAKLFRSNTLVRATAVDISKSMLSLLEKRCRAHAGRLRIMHASALSLRPAEETDLIVSHFFLDCLMQDDVEFLMRRVSGAVRPGTTWLISDFAVPQTGLSRFPAAIYIRLLYLAFRATTGLRVQRLPDIEGPMLRANFRRIARHAFLLGILYTELWELKGDHEVSPTQPADELASSTIPVANLRGTIFRA